MSESFAELFEESLKTVELKSGSIITGVVVDIDSEWVTVHAGLKSEGIIQRSEFLNEKGELEIEIGATVRVAMESVDDGFGETKLSREKAKRNESWEVLEKVYEDQEVIEGYISGRVKGGFTVEIRDIRAFLPGSLVDVRPLRDNETLEGQTLEFKVIKLDQKRNNVVVSRRAVLEAENSVERDELLKNLQEGHELKGIVKNLTDYGAFVDLGGIDGLLHITDMSWKRIKHPSEIVAVGDEIDVKVLKFDRERNRVSLGLKQLGEDPWVAITRRYPEGARTVAKVTNLTDYGCFAELEEGVEGLVHVSKWIGQTETFTHRKWFRLAMKLKSWCLISTKNVVVSPSGLSSVRAILGKSSPASTAKATRLKGTSSRSLTSGSLLVLKAKSMVWFIFLISPGMSRVSKRFVDSPRVMKLKP